MTVGSSDVPGTAFSLHPDRFFDSDPAVRRAAREVYEGTRDLPLVCPHGHVDPSLLSEDRAVPGAGGAAHHAGSLPLPDAVLAGQSRWSRWGCRPAIRRPRSSAIRGRCGACSRRTTTSFAEPRPGRWLDYELHELFGVRERLDARSADRIYDQIAERLTSPEFRPRALFDRFNIEVLATTDAATDALGHHKTIRAVGLERPRHADLSPGRAVPDRAPHVARRGRGARARDRRLDRHVCRLPPGARRAARRVPRARGDRHRPRRRGAAHRAPGAGRRSRRCSRRRSAATQARRTRSASRRTC